MPWQIFKTIKSIRECDKRIFDKNASWYNEHSDDNELGSTEAESDKTMKRKTYKDIVREQILKQGPDVDSDVDKERHGDFVGGKSASLAYDREQKALRKKFLDVAHELSDGSSSDEDLGILKVRVQTNKEREMENKLLKKALDEIVDVKGDDAAERDKFLYDYMLNKKWNIPTKGSRDKSSEPDAILYDIIDEDEDETEAVDNFESKYNFRFEELNDGEGRGADGAVSVVGHSRAVEGSVRRVDDRRKKARETRKERKEKEKRQKEAELRRLKNIKKKEVLKLLHLYFSEPLSCTNEFSRNMQLEERLSKILDVGGLSAQEQKDAIALLGEDLDEDWDPEKHEVIISLHIIIVCKPCKCDNLKF